MEYVETKGKIYSREAYAQAKMLDHSLWYGVLPRNITPSDIDMIIDNDGLILFVEFSSKTASWHTLKSFSYGQWKCHRNLVFNGQGKQFSALCKIKPKPDEDINSMTDIIEFSLMTYDKENDDVRESKLWTGENWKTAVQNLLGITK
ncbi:hypothetical protein [Thalassoglobus sp.]|uniref:hypothetical protein n=1 Tax=Thalassoglobus sp. TaxID=2795869 RepID=UPI003AA7D8B0